MLKSDLAKKADLTFYQLLGLGAGFLFFLFFLAFKISSLMIFLVGLFWHRLEVICDCLNYLSFANHPFIFTFLILIALGLTLLLSLIITKIIKLKILTNKFVGANLANRSQVISPILIRLTKENNLENKIIEIQNAQPIIFCFGLIRSKICLSSGSIKKLSRTELKAVLLHEQHHLLSHGPLKIFIVKALLKILFWLPGLKYFSNQYLVFSELAADEWATESFKNKICLASALSKALNWRKELLIKNELAISFFADLVMEERVNKLADDNYQPQFRIFNFHLVAGVFSLSLIFIFIFGLFSFSNSALASSTNNSCSLTSQNLTSHCQISVQQTICQLESYGFHNSICTD